jgi:hypothetical protein
MGSVYARGESLWLKYNGTEGDVIRRPSGYRGGEEKRAAELLTEVER